MKVFLTIWITAILIQEVIPGTLVRLPRHAPKQPALVETEYEAKYEQTGQHGNENSGLFSGKQEIVHDSCGDNWNVFANKCASLVKDLIASLANTVSSRPGDATKLHLQIKNTFRHFDNTHNCTRLNDKGKNIPLDLSRLLNNITISTTAPTANSNRNSTLGLGSNGDGDDGNGSSDGRDNNFGTLNSHPAGVTRKPNTVLDHAKNPGFSPENDEDSLGGSNNRRQAEYPQVSWQPGNKTRHSQNNHGRSNISRSPYPFIVTPEPNSAYESPARATYSDGNDLPNGGNGIGSNDPTNSNASPAGASGESSVPLRIQTLPATNTYNSEPASDSQNKAGVGVPATSRHNSAYTAAVPPAFDDHYRKVPAIPAPDGHNLNHGYSLSNAPVTDDSYDSKPVPVKPMTDSLSDPKFLTNNFPNSDSYGNKPQLALSTSNSQTPENPLSSDSHALSKNQHNSPVAEIIEPVLSPPPEDSWLDLLSRTPNTEQVLTIDRPEVLSFQKDKKVGIPVINSDSNIPESRGPESQWGTTNPLPTGRNPNHSSADVKTGSSAIPEVLPASINDEYKLKTFAPTTNKFSDTINLPLDHVPSSVYVKPALPEADNHKSEDPAGAGHTLNNPSDRTDVPVTVTPCSLSQNVDPLGGSGSENVYGDPERVTVYPVYATTTMSLLGYNIDVKPEGNSGSESNTGEDDCEENHAQDPGKNIATVQHPYEQSLQDTGKPQSNVEIGVSSIQNGIGQSISNTDPDNEYNEDGEDCDENMDSDPVTNAGTGNDGTPAIVPPVNPVSKISDPVVQAVQGEVPASDDGDRNMRFGNDPNSLSGTSSDTGTSSDATTSFAVSQVKTVSTVSDPPVHALHENDPAHDDDDDCDEDTEPSNDATSAVVPPVHPVSKTSDPVLQGNVPAFDNGGKNMISGKDPNGLSDSSATGTSSDATTSFAVSQVKPVSTVSDPAVHELHENEPAPDDDDDCDEDAEASNDATPPVAVSPVQSDPTVSDPVLQTVQGNVPASNDGVENMITGNDPNSLSDTSFDKGITNNANTAVAVSQVKTVSTVSDPAVHALHENDPAHDDDDDCDEDTEPSDDATPAVVPPVHPVSKTSDPVLQGNVPAFDNIVPPVYPVSKTTDPVLQGNVPAFDNVVPPVHPVSKTSDPVLQGNVPAFDNIVPPVYPVSKTTDPVLQGNVPAFDNVVPPVHPVSKTSDPVLQGNVPAFDNVVPPVYPVSKTTDPVLQGNVPALENVVPPVYPVSKTTDPVLQGNVPAFDNVVPPVHPVSKTTDPVLQGNVPAFDSGGENIRSGNVPNTLSGISSETGTANDANTAVAVSQVKSVSTVSDPIVHAVQENIPAFDDNDENMRSGNDPNGLSGISSDTGTAKDATTPVAVSHVKPVSTVSDPAVNLLHENVPALEDRGENTESSNDPNSAPDSSSNTRTANDAITPVAVSPIEPLSTVSESAGQSVESGGSPQSNTGSGVDGVQNGNIQSTSLNVTPLPYTVLPDGDTPKSTSSEGQSGNPDDEDSALYKPTTFQTTATDPTSPQSILIPTESTRRLTPVPTASQSTVRGSTSPLSKENDEDDEDEDCCSCESCTDEITNPKQYKESACKNLEEARRELKAIFDRIKKKLKCGRKACSNPNQTIGQSERGTSLVP